MISCEHLSKVFEKRDGRVVALSNVDLRVDEGEFLSVVGPSGSGKSTLLMILGGLIRPTSGAVTVAGTSLADLRPAELSAFRARTVGFVFQLFHLVPYLTSVENVLLAAYSGRSGSADPSTLLRTSDSTRAEELLTSMGLGDRLTHTPGELSAGEKQRVALARALFSDPPLLLADEPTGNLDPERGRVVLDHLAKIHQEGKTVVLVSHSPEVAGVAQRTVTLRAGHLTAP